MSDRAKKAFLIITIFGSFLGYSIYYYAWIFREAPYNAKEFRSFAIRYGARDSMMYYYNSATGEYNYSGQHDSLIKTHLYLTKADLDSIHAVAETQGLWNFPDNEENADTTIPGYRRFERDSIQFTYMRKVKNVVFDVNFDGPVKLIDANRQLIKNIKRILRQARERQAKQATNP